MTCLVDWSVERHQPCQPPWSHQSLGGWGNPRGPQEAVPWTDPDPMGQLSPP